MDVINEEHRKNNAMEARKEPILSFIFTSSLKVEFEPEKGSGEVNTWRRKGWECNQVRKKGRIVNRLSTIDHEI